MVLLSYCEMHLALKHETIGCLVVVVVVFAKVNSKDMLDILFTVL